jgi:phosphonoacetate hydrolase
MSIATTPFTVNGRTYQPPAQPVAVICLDGSAEDYLVAAADRGRIPSFQSIGRAGYRGLARAALPSFTNVNNSSIVTGVPPSMHGISGNFFYDPARNQEVMMNSASYLRADTIPAAAARAGRKVAVITAKEKLRDIFAHRLVGPPPHGSNGIAFSSEKANQAALGTHGIDQVENRVGAPTPPIYSPDASLYVLEAGAKLLEAGLADFLSLSTTDYMQHRYGPTAPESLDFYAGYDRAIGKLLELGAVIGITADHGMNAKQKPDGTPNVLYLESMLNQQFGDGFRVILPITDPYVVHHGALGSFAVVHLPTNQPWQPIAHFLLDQSGITEVYDRDTAARKLELPADRLGELVVLSARDVVLGRTPEHHDLSVLESPLRSHGGRYEEMVPFLVSAPLRSDYAARAAADLRNFDIFDFTLNGPLMDHGSRITD